MRTQVNVDIPKAEYCVRGSRDRCQFAVITTKECHCTLFPAKLLANDTGFLKSETCLERCLEAADGREES